ncbi:MAG: hypothetical protein ACOVP4_09160 [Bacteriovoracaceae bacterium]|jgi:hypothetical protein
MGIKLGSVVAVILFIFIAKISFESATAETQQPASYRGPASIDKSYTEYNNRSLHQKTN